MKTKSHRLFLLPLPLLLISLAASSIVEAQEEEPPTKDRPSNIYLFGMSGEGEVPQTMEESVEQLKIQATHNGDEMPNVIFEGNARSVEIPQIELRNVTAIDALQLLAVSAACQVEPILDATGLDGVRVIGFRIRGPESGALIGAAFGAMAGGSPGTARAMAGGSPGTASAANDSPAVPPPPGTISLTPSTGIGAAPPAAAPVFFPGGMGGSGGAMVFGSQGRRGTGGGEMMEEQEPKSVVYALAPAVGSLTREKVEQGLEEMLDTEPRAQGMTLGIHEGTNTLIVRGNELVHSMVASFLAALAENNAVAQKAAGWQAENEAIRTVTQLELELQGLRMQLERQEERLARSEAEKDAIREELLKARDSGNSGKQ